MHIFDRPNNEYKRELDIQAYAKDDLAFYLSKMENIDFNSARNFVEENVKARDVDISILSRQKNGDKKLANRTLLSLLKEIQDNDLIVAPSMTVYIPPNIKKSVLAEYIQMNMKLRKADKHSMFIWRMRGDSFRSGLYKVRQESRKVKNNSLSGTHSSPSTPWYNLSNHSSLTSTCRCATSYANSGNEKFLGGLRHYYVPNIVFYHITVASRHSNLEAIERAMVKFNLHYPTAEECMDIVRYSTQYYWTNPDYEKQIFEYLEQLTPLERAAFAYTGDFYHIDKYNGKFVEQFFKDLTVMKTGVHQNPQEQIKSLDDNFTAISTLLCAPLIKGVSLGDALEERPEAYHAVALTSENLTEQMKYYIDFIHGFIRQDYLPTSIAAFPTSMRMSVPTSDTDSTIFTTQYWVHKYGGTPYEHKANSIQYIMTFLIAGMTVNTLKMYSKNLGVRDEQLSQLEMKNEYIFPTFALTSLAKHYFNFMSAQEGNVYSKLVTDIKGVNMRSSNAPPAVNEAAKLLMESLMLKQIENKDIYLKDVLVPVVKQELEIIDALHRGDPSVYNSVQIKDATSYTQGENAPAYKAHLFWNKIFGPKYGFAPEPPYRAIKVSANLPNKTAVQEWLDVIDDKEIKASLKEWVELNIKNDIAVFRLPRSTIEVCGLPAELKQIVNTRKLTLEIMKPFYYILEVCGLFMLNSNNTRLISDEYLLVGEEVFRKH